jgi:hypothetical protein
MIETLRCRRRALENSAATALIAASMPPMPRPVRIRHALSAYSPVTVVAMNMPTAISTRQPRIVGRRPKRSARPPSRTEPMAMPTSSIDSTKPSAARSIPHSAAMPGDAKLIERTSNPSSALSATVIATTVICRRLIGDSAMTSRGSAIDLLYPVDRAVRITIQIGIRRIHFGDGPRQ